MSFHEDSFHETKRERKKYENKKQKALKYIKHFQTEVSEIYPEIQTNPDKIIERIQLKLRKLKVLVNDI